MIIRTIIINNQQYKKRLKKNKYYSIILSKKTKEKNLRQFYYELQSIKINVTQKRFNKSLKRKSLNK